MKILLDNDKCRLGNKNEIEIARKYKIGDEVNNLCGNIPVESNDNILRVITNFIKVNNNLVIYVIGSDFCYVERTNIDLIEELEKLDKLDIFKIEEIDDKYSDKKYWNIINSEIKMNTELIKCEERLFNIIQNYRDWVSDIENGNIITLKFLKGNNLIVSKQIIISRSEVIRNFINNTNNINEIEFPVYFSTEDLNKCKKYLLESDENCYSEIINFLNIK